MRFNSRSPFFHIARVVGGPRKSRLCSEGKDSYCTQGSAFCTLPFFFSFCIGPLTLYSSISSSICYRTSPHLPHPYQLCAHYRALSHDSVNFLSSLTMITRHRRRVGVSRQQGCLHVPYPLFPHSWAQPVPRRDIWFTYLIPCLALSKAGNRALLYPLCTLPLARPFDDKAIDCTAPSFVSTAIRGHFVPLLVFA